MFKIVDTGLDVFFARIANFPRIDRKDNDLLEYYYV